MKDTFSTSKSLTVGDRELRIAHLPSLESSGFDVARLPFSMRILLENLLRREDGGVVSASDIEAVAKWDPAAQPSVEIAFAPARVLLQDFTGVPAVVDLAAMRDAMVAMSGDAKKINPLQPVELVIDHSVQVDEYGTAAAFLINVDREFERNRERYGFLKWGQGAFDNFKRRAAGHRDLPSGQPRVPGARGDGPAKATAPPSAYPDTLVGTDSHTTMINGLGVLGWGVGGIEAEAAMLGQPISMLVPQVVGFKPGGRARRRRHRDRPRAGSRRCCARRAWSASSSSTSAPACRPAAGRPRDDRQHGAGVRRDLRHLPGRPDVARLPAPSPAARPSWWRWSRRT